MVGKSMYSRGVVKQNKLYFWCYYQFWQALPELVKITQYFLYTKVEKRRDINNWIQLEIM